MTGSSSTHASYQWCIACQAYHALPVCALDVSKDPARRNLCNCPNCATDNCPAAGSLENAEALVRDMAMRHGQFISDLTFAAFGHRDALTYEQILAGVTSMRKGIETTLANQIEITRKIIGGAQ